MIITKKERIIVTAPFTVYHSQSLFLEADSGSVTASAYSLVLGSLTGLSLPRLPPLYKGHDASLGGGELCAFTLSLSYMGAACLRYSVFHFCFQMLIRVIST